MKLENVNVNRGWRPDLPYNDLPTLPPKIELETRAVLKQCITARAALAELKQAAELIPNQGILIGTLPLLEAQASSEIENIVTSADRLFQFKEMDEKADPATKEALRYGHALTEGLQSLQRRPLTAATAETVCSRIKGIDMTVRRVPGDDPRQPPHSRSHLHPAGGRTAPARAAGQLGEVFA